MSNLVKIDSNLLAEDIQKMKNVTNKMRDLFTEIKNETNSLKDVWVTKTSEAVYLDLEEFHRLAENTVSINESDTLFLENVVKANYVNMETKTNSLVDTNIAI